MKVLIIEDDPMVGMIHQQFCQKINGIRETKIVKSLGEAREAVEPYLPDLILLDNYLPDGQGVQLLHELEDFPIIMVTAADDTKTLRQAFSNGIVDYLVKPFSFERFYEAIQRATRFRNLFQGETVEQESIDHFFVQQIANSQEDLEGLPKGLSLLTLQKIVPIIIEKHQAFSTQDVADEMHISRVTIKKYLNYLVEINALYEDIDYSTSGRPLTLYLIKDIQALRSYKAG